MEYRLGEIQVANSILKSPVGLVTWRKKSEGSEHMKLVTLGPSKSKHDNWNMTSGSLVGLNQDCLECRVETQSFYDLPAEIMWSALGLEKSGRMDLSGSLVLS